MTVDLILEAGEKGCMLIAFPEICEHISKPIRRADTNTIKGSGVSNDPFAARLTSAYKLFAGTRTGCGE
jgi:hypothetical protein